MPQSKLASFVEAVANTLLGLLIALVATQAICLANDIPMTLENNLVLTFWMTVISVVRGYVIRRMWNAEFWKHFFSSRKGVRDVINIRQKGAEGEREIYRALNPIIQRVLVKLGYPDEVVQASANAVQRNQNQSAVGGNDLSNTFGLSIEVKRQEALSVNSWWGQCVAAAQRNNELPVLLYRQNRKPWRCVTLGWVPLGGVSPNLMKSVRVEISWEEFLAWFEEWVEVKLQEGAEVRS